MVSIFFTLFYALSVTFFEAPRTTTTTNFDSVFNSSVSELSSEKLIFFPSIELKPPKLTKPKRRFDVQPQPFETRNSSSTATTRRYKASILSNMPSFEGPITLLGSFRRPKAKVSKSSKEVASPFDINQIVFDRQEGHLESAQKIYRKIVGASRHSLNDEPFQLMLDVYPLQSSTATKSSPTVNRFSPYAAKYNALNSLHHEKAYTTFFETMKFPQIQPRNPLSPLNEPKYREKILRNPDNMPSQLIVHLNLYPKKKKKKHLHNGIFEKSNEYFKRSDEDLINYDENQEFYKNETSATEFPYKFEVPPFKVISPKLKNAELQEE